MKQNYLALKILGDGDVIIVQMKRYEVALCHFRHFSGVRPLDTVDVSHCSPRKANCYDGCRSYFSKFIQKKPNQHNIWRT